MQGGGSIVALVFKAQGGGGGLEFRYLLRQHQGGGEVPPQVSGPQGGGGGHDEYS